MNIQKMMQQAQQMQERMQKQMLASGGGAPGESPLSAGGGSMRPVTGEKVGRNDQCPCGSGKKYKHCHGQLS